MQKKKFSLWDFYRYRILPIEEKMKNAPKLTLVVERDESGPMQAMFSFKNKTYVGRRSGHIYDCYTDEPSIEWRIYGPETDEVIFVETDLNNETKDYGVV